MALSQARAHAILSILALKGLKTGVAAVSVGTAKPLLNEFKQKDEQLNRSVTFKGFLTNASNLKSTKR